MIRIAICDDDLDKGQGIYSKVRCLVKKYHGNYQIRLFSDSKALLYETEDGTDFDLLLLDIEMPEIDGMQLTELIKGYLPDVLVIFISSHEKYVYEAFKVQPFRFVPKTFIDRMLPLAIEDAIEYLKKTEGKYICVDNQEGLEKIPTKCITYIWHKEKYAYIEKTNGERAKVRKTLKKIYEELPSGDFIWIDRGCICSLLQISRIYQGNIILKDGMRLMVSRDRLTEVKDTIRRYWLGKEDGI